MNVPRRQFLQLAAGVAALPAASRIARAERYPTRPVHIISGFAAGAGGDTIASVGTGRGARAAADGHALVLVASHFVVNLAPFLLLVFASIPATASPKITVLAFGLFGAQSVFESEAKGAADIVAHQLDADALVVRANTKRRGEVTIASIENALQSAAERMDRQNDLLFLILTSHGSQAGVAVQASRREETLTPAALAGMLSRTGVQHRIVVISACYSGVFVDPLANDNTLVITAADFNHSSFGCQDKVKWTYFGDAFFNKALRHTADVRGAFATARKLISVRERQEGLVPSNPQIAGGKNIDILLAERRGVVTTGQQQ